MKAAHKLMKHKDQITDSSWIFDATAGIGYDSWFLASAGFNMILFERNPVVFKLLEDGLQRAQTNPKTAETANRMVILEGDFLKASEYLPDLIPDMVLIYPMFPPNPQYKHQVSKYIQTLRYYQDFFFRF